MSNSVLSIGGAGHRSLKPLVFLAAAGALDDTDVSLLCIDNDATNGNLSESLEIVHLYNRVRGAQRWLGDSPLFRPRLQLMDDRPWSPLNAQDSEPTLDSYLRHDSMTANAADLASLYEFLYEPDKRKLPVTEGFRGKPSIGAAVYRAAAETGAMTGAVQDGLQRIREELEKGTAQARHARLFTMGSVFGGTGAAGLPTIPSTLIANMRQGADHVISGGAFLLPYFDFNPGSLDQQGPHANPSEFVMMMKDALRYYQLNPSGYQCVYAIGADKWRHVPTPAVGKAEQKNPADLVEFLAAVAASHFLVTYQPAPASQNGHGPKLFVLHRGQEAAFQWADVPEHDRLKPKLAALTRFCFLFLNDYEQELQKAAKGHLKPTWYVRHIQAADVNPSTSEFQNQVKALGDFCRAFLRWWVDLQNNAGLAINLAHTSAFTQRPFVDEAFSTLITGERYGLTSKQAVQKVAGLPFERQPDLIGLGHFVHALATATA
ncbi:MAG: hypothetical protein JO061_24755 [Acidobacteriaceae bacterium]|nr:hypothetical protein [Acidobacteriaceae bacterium]